MTTERHVCVECGHVFRWGEDADSDIVQNQTCRANAHWKLHDHMKAAHPEKLFVCGRQNEGFRASSEPEAYWEGDRTCSYCGSISPDELFQLIEAGAEIGPTDKGYKIYVDRPNLQAGENAIYSSANHKLDSDGYVLLTDELAAEKGLNSYYRANYVGRWVRIEPARAVDHAKFYFQHLDEAGRQRFIDLINSKKMKIGYPGHFYVLPYFAKRAA